MGESTRYKRSTGSGAVATGGSRGSKLLSKFLAAWTFCETGGAIAEAKIRDSLALPTETMTLAAGAVGSFVETGVHYYARTWITANGESTIGPLAEINVITAAKKVAVSGILPHNNLPGGDAVTGTNLYRTKADAPAHGSIPTNAQLFLVAASPVIGDNVTTTYLDAIPDASLQTGHPPVSDRTGEVIAHIKLASGASLPAPGSPGDGVDPLHNEGGACVDIVAGTIDWTLWGA